jgi:hypothetical protein
LRGRGEGRNGFKRGRSRFGEEEDKRNHEKEAEGHRSQEEKPFFSSSSNLRRLPNDPT